ncbi:MAG: RNA methyltransferase [Armatimonadetes bacterium]|nr:RNA methyltransferase [Armatimonadota bacterium]
MDESKPVITSRQNLQIKKARSLLERKFRERHRAFLVEGPRAISELLKSGWEVESLFYDPRAFDAGTLWRQEPAGDSSQRLRGYGFLQPVSQEVLRCLTEVEQSQGCVAVARMPQTQFEDWQPSERSLVILTDGVSDPGNLGAILRTADAFEAEAVLLTEDCVDPFNPKCVRASAGSLFHLPVFQTTPAALIMKLEGQGFQVAGTSPLGGVVLTEATFADRLALVLGHETHGISPEIAQHLDMTISIPTSPRTESLNVAAACAVVCWEIHRRTMLKAGSGQD